MKIPNTNIEAIGKSLTIAICLMLALSLNGAATALARQDFNCEQNPNILASGLGSLEVQNLGASEMSCLSEGASKPIIDGPPGTGICDILANPTIDDTLESMFCSTGEFGLPPLDDVPIPGICELLGASFAGSENIPLLANAAAASFAAPGQELSATYLSLRQAKMNLGELSAQLMARNYPGADPIALANEILISQPSISLENFLETFYSKIDPVATDSAQIPIEILTYFATSSLPAVDSDNYFERGLGISWINLLQNAMRPLNTHIISETNGHITGKAWDFPSDEFLENQLEARHDRAILSMVLAIFIFEQARITDSLNSNLNQIGSLALVSTFDLAIFQALSTRKVDTCISYEPLLQEALTVANGVLALALQIVGDLPSVQEIVDIAERVTLGEWIDSILWTAGSELEVFYHDSIQPLEEPIVNLSEALAQTVFETDTRFGNSQPSAGANYQGTGVAITDESESATWSIDTIGMTGELTEYEWAIPIVGQLYFKEGLLGSVENSPAIMSETDGLIKQGTSARAPRVILTNIPPSIEYGDKHVVNPGLCVGGTFAVLGATALGVAGIMTAPVTAGGSLYATALGATVVVESALTLQATCVIKAKETYNGGSYTERQTYINTWHNFGWEGAPTAVDPLGLIQRYGSMYANTLADINSQVEFVSGSTTSQERGLQITAQDRQTFLGIQELAKSMFRQSAGNGDAEITVNVSCIAPVEYWGEYDVVAIPALDPASAICLQLKVGTVATSELKSGDQGLVSFNSAGIKGSGGYIEVNGERTQTPVMLQVEGSGLNYDQTTSTCGSMTSTSSSGEPSTTEYCI